jgi:serine/threonine-protein kinase HipA
MKKSKCLVCCEITETASYHPRCAKELFGLVTPVLLDFLPTNVEELAKNLVNRHLTVPGVQRKLSLGIAKSEDSSHRITVIGVLGGSHILKPPSPEYPEMPELEHVTMLLARMSGIKTADCGLIAMKDGSLAYIVRRFDRYGRNKKLAVEDLCQLSELASENKYKSSCEKVGKVIRKFSHNPGDDALRFFELAVFSFLVGNSDMHMKNYSLLESKLGMVGMSPAYDLLATDLLISDPEESALTINGKKSKLKRTDFVALGQSLLLPEKAVEFCLDRQLIMTEAWCGAVNRSFLSTAKKAAFCELIKKRCARLN